MGITSLRKFISPEIVFGCDARKLAGRYAKKLCTKKIMIVSDAGVIAHHWLKDIVDSLEAESIDYVIFSDISPNPRSDEVMKGAAIYTSENCDSIIAIGGGSPMDCAKGIGIVSTNKNHIFTYEGIDMIHVPCPPLIFVPTTAGTSADVSQFAIITNREEKRKFAIISKAIVPDIALIDPSTTLTMSSYLTACTGIDALVHAIEAYVSIASSPITDIHALEAIRLINEYLPSVIKDPLNIDYRSNIMLASMEAGLAFSNAILGAVHAMAHSLGGFLDLPHGECNALLLEHVINFNYSAIPDKYDKIANIFNINTSSMTADMKKNALINHIISLKHSVGITKSLGHAGVTIQDIPELAKKAVKDPCIITNPRNATQRDIEVVYEDAL